MNMRKLLLVILLGIPAIAFVLIVEGMLSVMRTDRRARVEREPLGFECLDIDAPLGAGMASRIVGIE